MTAATVLPFLTGEGIADSTAAGIITSVATVLTALGGLVLALSVLVPILRNSRKTIEKLDAVHVIVNQQRTDAKRYQLALVAALDRAGVDVPVDQSLPVLGTEDAEIAPTKIGSQ